MTTEHALTLVSLVIATAAWSAIIFHLGRGTEEDDRPDEDSSRGDS